jgi:hypothetical protein
VLSHHSILLEADSQGLVQNYSCFPWLRDKQIYFNLSEIRTSK